MGGVRFTLKWLFVAVAFVALACLGLVYASPQIANLCFLLAIILMFVAVLGVFNRRDATRAFWTGFAVFGWGYLLLLGVNPLQGANPIIPANVDRLATSTLLELLYPCFQRPWNAPPGVDYNISSYPEAVAVPSTGGRIIVSVPHKLCFLYVGQSLLCIIFANLGGFLAQYFYATGHRSSAT